MAKHFIWLPYMCVFGVKSDRLLVPPYLKRTKAIEEFLPWLYLKGVSTGDFTETMQSLLGKNAPGLSSNTICRLKKDWITEHNQWQKRIAWSP